MFCGRIFVVESMASTRSKNMKTENPCKTWPDVIKVEQLPDRPNRSSSGIPGSRMGQFVVLRESKVQIADREKLMFQINVEYGTGTRCNWMGIRYGDALKVFDFEVNAMKFGIMTGGWANVPTEVKMLILGRAKGDLG